MSSTAPITQDPPEALGPGTYDDSGGVGYGVTPTGAPRIGRIEPQYKGARHPDTPADWPVNVPWPPRQDEPRCRHCRAIPDEILTPLRAALAGRKDGGR